MAAADAATLEAIGVAQAHLVEKYGEAIDRESAYEKLAAEKSAAAEADALAAERAQLEKERAEFEKQKAAEADRAAKAAAKEEERAAKAAEKEAERAQKAAEKEAERATRAAEKQREQAMKTVSSVIGQIGARRAGNFCGGCLGTCGSRFSLPYNTAHDIEWPQHRWAAGAPDRDADAAALRGRCGVRSGVCGGGAARQLRVGL